MEHKVCALCKEPSPIEVFQLNSKSGKRSSYCPKCLKQKKRESYERNRESIIAKNKEYALENLEKTREYQAQYRDEHREERNEAERVRRAEKHDEIRVKANDRWATDPEFRAQSKERNRLWRIQFNEKLDKDPELKQYYQDKWAEARARWIQNNPEKYLEKARIQASRRRAWIRTGNHYDLITQYFVDMLKIQQNYKCAYCAGVFDKFDLDHIIPLSRGGQHTPDNVCLACEFCNSSKHNKILYSEWIPPKDR